MFSLALIFLMLSCQEGIKKTAMEDETRSGADLFQAECQKCHGLRRVISAFRDEETWINTISRMRDKNKADITSEEIEQLVKFHVERQKKETAVFKSKCQKCHPGGRFVQKALTPAQARIIIKKMQEKAGNTIKDEDVQLIINYHMREHQLALKKSMQSAFSNVLEDYGIDPEALTLFVEKCSSCHELERSMFVYKDEQAWQKTIKKMQAYSRGLMTDDEVNRLVAFHAKRQKTELEVFRETCLACHTAARIFRRSMTEEEWLATVKKMQEKAPTLINDEKITILTNFHQKQENIMASLFEGQCKQCHIYLTRAASMSTGAKYSLKILASEKFAADESKPDIDELIIFHSERERREMDVFGECSKCHPEGRSKSYNTRTREDWILLISSMQDKVFSQKVATGINTQINFHVAKHNQ